MRGTQARDLVTLSPSNVYYFVVRGYNLQGTLGPASAEAQVDLRTPAPTAQNHGDAGGQQRRDGDMADGQRSRGHAERE